LVSITDNPFLVDYANSIFKSMHTPQLFPATKLSPFVMRGEINRCMGGPILLKMCHRRRAISRIKGWLFFTEGEVDREAVINNLLAGGALGLGLAAKVVNMATADL